MSIALPEAAPAASDDFDALGRPFDPAKFRREKDSLGRWKNLHAGRKPKAGSAAADTSAPPPPPTPDFADIERIAAAESAADAVLLDENATADTVIGAIQTALVLIGDEEGVMSDTEKALLRRPLLRVLEKYNIGKDVMPAEVDLCIAISTLLIVRLQKPKTATWFAKAKAMVANLVCRFRGRALARAMREHVGPVPQA